MKASRAKISVFCSVLFLGLVLAPGCMHLFDSEHEITIFIDLNEEEEKKGSECVEDIEFRIAEMAYKNTLTYQDRNKPDAEYSRWMISLHFSEIISPPPELFVS